MKIGILGGSFDPIHLGHTAIVECSYQQLNLDQVWVMPNKKAALKNHTPTPIFHRLNMAHLALENIPYCHVDYSEVNNKLGEYIYTIDTIKEILEDHPEYEIYFIIGGDQIANLHLWKSIDELSKLVKFIGFHRADYDEEYIKENLIKYNVIMLEGQLFEVASTNIRKYNFSNVDPLVKNYIIHSGLYLDTAIMPYLSDKRYAHTLDVAKKAQALAILNDIDPLSARNAGLLHDITKELDPGTQEHLMLRYKGPVINHREVLHQYTATIIAKEKFFIKTPEVFQAISRHCSADLEMATLDKILYVADMIACDRTFDGVEELRRLAFIDLDRAFVECYRQTYHYLLEQNVKIDERSQEIYKKYCEETK